MTVNYLLQSDNIIKKGNYYIFIIAVLILSDQFQLISVNKAKLLTQNKN